MQNIYDLSKEEIAQYLKILGEPAYRAGQIFSALHNGTEVSDIPNIPKNLREKLSSDFHALLPNVEKELTSKDGTKKYLLKLAGNDLIECVFLTQEYGNTVCISSQIGCKMNCAFCASGKDGFIRNLTAGEMLSQVLLLNKLNRTQQKLPQNQPQNCKEIGQNQPKNSGNFDQNQPKNSGKNGQNEQINTGNRPVSNIVIMGSGEPFDNFDNTTKFLNLVTAPDGINISARNISVSTAGLPDKIRAFADLSSQVNLCISLHAPNDTIRQTIMPIAKAHSISTLIESAKYFFQKTKRRVIFEYSLIDNTNCEPEHAIELSKLLRGFSNHVNLINLNPTGGPLNPPTREKAMKFMDTLIKSGISCTMRKSKGDDIAGACGQLRIKFAEKKNPVFSGEKVE